MNSVSFGYKIGVSNSCTNAINDVQNGQMPKIQIE